MFNPQPPIARLPLAPGRDAWVVDNVLLDPHALRARALRERGNFVASPYNAYPGIEWQMGPEVSEPLAEFFMLHIRQRLQHTLGPPRILHFNRQCVLEPRMTIRIAQTGKRFVQRVPRRPQSVQIKSAGFDLAL